MTSIALIALCGLLAFGAGSASAATVSLSFEEYEEDLYGDSEPAADELHFTAAPGEANRLTITRNGHTLTIRDPGANLSATGACTSVATHEVRCLLVGAVDEPDVLAAAEIDLADGEDALTITRAFDAVEVKAGAGNDIIDTGSARASIRAGAGNDTVTSGADHDSLDGGTGSDRLNSGAGDDTLQGGTGRDVMHAGAGADTLDDADQGFPDGAYQDDATPVPARVDADVLDGGPGRDTVEYSEREHGVHVDLSRPGSPAGAKGEGDRVRAVEDVYGSYDGHNVLIGDDRRNRLSGGQGGNVLIGNGGSDQLASYDGNDRAVGGAGNDVIETGGGDDSLDGGPGNDSLRAGYTRDDKPDSYRGGRGNDRLWTAGDFGGLRQRDRIECDAGHDVILPDSYDVVPGDCERVGLGDDDPKLFLRAHPLTVSATNATFAVPCPVSFAEKDAKPCHGVLTVQTRNGTKLGSHSYRVKVGHQTQVVVKLSAAGRRVARHGGVVRVRVSMAVRRKYADVDEHLTAVFSLRLRSAVKLARRSVLR